MNFFQIIYKICLAFIQKFHFYDEIQEPETKSVVDYDDEDEDDEDYDDDDEDDEDYEPEDEDYETEDEDYEPEDEDEYFDSEEEEETTPVVEPEPLKEIFYITPDTEEEIFKNKRFLGRLTWAKIVRSYVLQNEITTFETTKKIMNSLKRNVVKVLKPPFYVKTHDTNTNNQQSIKVMTCCVFSKKNTNTKLNIILKDINKKLFCIKISN